MKQLLSATSKMFNITCKLFIKLLTFIITLAPIFHFNENISKELTNMPYLAFRISLGLSTPQIYPPSS